MLRDNPLLTVLGRKGRGAVVDALRAEPERIWTVRDLARAADVPVITASRAVRELDALGVVDAFRPGRDKHVRWEPTSAVAQALGPFLLPDLRQQAAAAFVDAFDYADKTGQVRWKLPNEDASDPLCPTRIAILLPPGMDEEEVIDAIGPALDSVADAGWPRPQVTTHQTAELQDDPLSEALRLGLPLT